MAVGTVILGRLVDGLTLQTGVVAIQAGNGLLRCFRMRIVAFLTVGFSDGGMNHPTRLLSLVACFAGCRLLDDGEQPWLKGAVRIVAPVTFVSEDHRTVFAVFQLRVASQTQGRNTVDEVVFKFRAVGVVAVVTALFRRCMVVPRVKYPGVTVQADKGVSRIGGVGIMAALAFCVAYRCVLLLFLDDIHVARRAGSVKG